MVLPSPGITSFCIYQSGTWETKVCELFYDTLYV